MTDKTQGWRKSGSQQITQRTNQTKALQIFTQTAMQHPQLQASLDNYINLLDKAVTNGIYTPQQASNILISDMRKLSRDIHMSTQALTNPPIQVDQTDLTIPENMQIALQNPDSFASQQVDSTAGAITESLNEQAAEITEAIDQSSTVDTTETTASAEHTSTAHKAIAHEALDNAALTEASSTQETQSETTHAESTHELTKATLTLGVIELTEKVGPEAEGIIEKCVNKAIEAITGFSEKATKDAEEEVSSFKPEFKPPPDFFKD